ncbi:MAG: FAD-dependent oxidoreductase, partial [Geobacteraceae bacterium]
MIHAALFRREAGLGARLGIGLTEGGIDFAALSQHKDSVVQLLRQTRYLDILQNVPGLKLVKGTGRFIDSRTIEVGGRRIMGERFLIATGGFPRIIDFPGLEEIDYLTSRSALLLDTLPRTLVVIGGGVIAMELGQMYQRLGSKVTVLEHGPRI